MDSTAGALFDVEINDINGDGKEDLLVVSNGMNGSVLAYEIPNDFRLVHYVAEKGRGDRLQRLVLIRAFKVKIKTAVWK